MSNLTNQFLLLMDNAAIPPDHYEDILAEINSLEESYISAVQHLYDTEESRGDLYEKYVKQVYISIVCSSMLFVLLAKLIVQLTGA